MANEPKKPGMVARVLDAAVAALSPAAALRRIDARARLAAHSAPEVAQAAADRKVAALRYEAAKLDRLRAKMTSGSADGDLLANLDTLR